MAAASQAAIGKRANWLNANIFWQNAIQQRTVQKLSTISHRRAMELLRDVEDNAKNIGNPDGFLDKAIKREGQQYYGADAGGQYYGADAGGWREEQDTHTRLHRRCTWLNGNVFWPDAIDKEAISQLCSIDVYRAMEMLKEVESKAGQIENPGGYLKNAVRREGQGYGYGGYDDYRWSSWQEPQRAQQGEANNTIHRRATWINENVYWSHAIDNEAIIHLSGIDFSRAMEMLQDVETKVDDVSNPSGFLKAAVRRETYSGDEDIDSRVQKRCVWLNMNIFGKGAIDKDAMAKLSTLTYGRCMELCRDLEDKGDSIKNPSGYLKTAVAREPMTNVQAWAGGYARNG